MDLLIHTKHNLLISINLDQIWFWKKIPITFSQGCTYIARDGDDGKMTNNRNINIYVYFYVHLNSVGRTTNLEHFFVTYSAFNNNSRIQLTDTY